MDFFTTLRVKRQLATTLKRIAFHKGIHLWKLVDKILSNYAEKYSK